MGERGVMRRLQLAAGRQAIVSARQRAPQALQRQGNNVCQCNRWGHCKAHMHVGARAVVCAMCRPYLSC